MRTNKKLNPHGTPVPGYETRHALLPKHNPCFPEKFSYINSRLIISRRQTADEEYDRKARDLVEYIIKHKG